MSNLQLFEFEKNKYDVYHLRQKIGIIEADKNLFHKDNVYIKLRLNCYHAEFAKELFYLLKEKLKSPLQIMLYSNEKEQIDFLTAGGFLLKRRCYEMEITSRDLIDSISSGIDFFVVNDYDPEYEGCCRRVFEYYKVTHENISKLTATYDIFREKLPKMVLCDKKNGIIVHLAFIECCNNNYEIAYIHSEDNNSFSEFAGQLLHYLAHRASSVCFECDDCDKLSMVFLSFVKKLNEVSFNTYILE